MRTWTSRPSGRSLSRASASRADIRLSVLLSWNVSFATRRSPPSPDEASPQWLRSPALIVECTVHGVDFGIDRMGRPVQQRTGRGAPPRQPNPNRLDFLEGTLVID